MNEASPGVRNASRAPLGPELRVVAPAAIPWSRSGIGILASHPWCCVLPAGLASLGLASSLLTHWLQVAPPALLVASAASFAHAHYLIWARRRGSPLARVATVVSTALAAALWTLRL